LLATQIAVKDEAKYGVCMFFSFLKRKLPLLFLLRVLDRKMVGSFQNGLDVLYKLAKFGGERSNNARRK